MKLHWNHPLISLDLKQPSKGNHVWPMLTKTSVLEKKGIISLHTFLWSIYFSLQVGKIYTAWSQSQLLSWLFTNCYPHWHFNHLKSVSYLTCSCWKGEKFLVFPLHAVKGTLLSSFPKTWKDFWKLELYLCIPSFLPFN